MPWLQVKVATDSEHVDAVEQALGACGAQSVSLEDGGDESLLEPEPGATPLWHAVRVVAVFDEDADRDTIAGELARIGGEAAALEVAFDQLPDCDWSRVWLDDWSPQRFGQRLWVAPLEATVDAPDAVVVRLDPGLAFGTGTHTTTALCLEWLDAADLTGCRVLDYGCGSGILAIAALRLGAAAAVAVDIDPQALEATRANAVVNGVAERLHTGEPDAVDGRYPLIVANILAAPLIALAPRMAAQQARGDRLVLAGVLADQAAAVADAYAPWYALELGVERDGWVRLEGVRS